MKGNWLGTDSPSLRGKTVVLTGATGGLGSAMCRCLLQWGARIIMVTRNKEKSRMLCEQLQQEFPGCQVSFLLSDFEHIDQVKAVCRQLVEEPVDFLMLNAGTYALPRKLCSCGYDNVFTTNFISHYMMVKELLPLLRQRKAKVVVTGSISHHFLPVRSQ